MLALDPGVDPLPVGFDDRFTLKIHVKVRSERLLLVSGAEIAAFDLGIVTKPREYFGAPAIEIKWSHVEGAVWRAVNEMIQREREHLKIAQPDPAGYNAVVIFKLIKGGLKGVFNNQKVMGALEIPFQNLKGGELRTETMFNPRTGTHLIFDLVRL